MIEAAGFIEAARSFGFTLYTGVPCSYLKPFINYVIDDDNLRYIGATNEGDAVAIAAGAELGGQRSVVMFQNSGLGNAVSPLTSLTHIFQLPVLLIPTLRGERGGAPDEPQHELMGKITTELLELMGVAWEFFPTDEAEVQPALQRAVTHMEQHGRPYALVMRKGSVGPVSLASAEPALSQSSAAVDLCAPVATRQEILHAVQAAASPEDIIVATTGYTGRELYACDDRDNQIYMVGSMGCASSLGLGLATACPNRRVIVLDGDGAALMRMGALCTLGHERPENLIHVLLDNGLHESTGGQRTVSNTVNFPAVALASGYPRAISVAAPEKLAAELLAADDQLLFIHVPTLPGIPEGLPRPEVSPAEVAQRLRRFLLAQH
jgi:phosphonopyruvate decarboxylase